MPDSKVRTIRPMNLTSEIVVRPTGALDAQCAEELRHAVEYVVARPGGPIVIDCSGLSAVSAVGTSVLRWAEREHHGDRVVELRHLHPQSDEVPERPVIVEEAVGGAGGLS